MPVNRLDIAQFDEVGTNNTTLTQDNTNVFITSIGGETGGGSSTGALNSYLNLLNENTQPIVNDTYSSVFIFNISANVSNFQTIVNGVDSAIGSSKQIRISRISLVDQSYKIQIKANGYLNSNDYYLVEMVDDGAPLIFNPKIEQPLGITTKDVVLSFYKNGKLVGSPQSIKNKSNNDLTFTLTKTQRDTPTPEEPTSYTVSFNISGVGNPVSVLKNGNSNAEFFPSIGNSTYSDVENTKYIIRSSDASLYRITSIIWETNKLETLVAEPGETLELDITLSKNYSFTIKTEEIFQGTAATNPQIELLKTDARKYNINSKLGVPLMFRKNEDVKTITVIVGDDILEFDNLDKGTLCGITIPHSVFNKIGKYDIQIFPFSLDDYEDEVRPPTPADTVETKKVEVKYQVQEEVKLPEVTLSDTANPYKPIIKDTTQLFETPKSSGGSTPRGGGGGRPVFLDSGLDLFDPTNPFSNRGDFVNRPNINEAIR